MKFRTIVLYILFFCLLLGGGWWCLHRNFSVAFYSPEEQRYYRAVAVLQQLDESAADEPADVPASIKRHDDTVALFYHSDKAFVLRIVAQDLESLTADFPDARLFAAHAHLALGEHAQAASLLNSYVAENAYTAKHYALLCDAFAAANDPVSQYLMCTEWRDRDPSCSRARLLCTWSALYNLARYDEAVSIMLQEGDCLGFEGFLYAARAAYESGNASLVQFLLDGVHTRYPQERNKIDMVWERLLARVQF